MTSRTPLDAQRLLHTGHGRALTVSRLAPRAFPSGTPAIALGAAGPPYDVTEPWAVLTPAQALRLAALLTEQANAALREVSP
ncbi:hypothetical protein [Kitasatospora cineracea]|uniref:hypothetical protein n=1 Tax=Kitasatospora cineracea TaxID=88074 RepID=UPI0037A7F16F